MNVPVAQIPNAPKGALQSGLNPNLGQEVGQAMQNMGRQVGQIAQTADSFGDKLALNEFKGAKAKVELALSKANGEYDDYVAANPDKPETYEKTAREKFEAIEKNVGKSNLRPEYMESIQRDFALMSGKSMIRARSKATAQTIKNNNTALKEIAKIRLDNGDEEAAVQSIMDMSVAEGVKMGIIKDMYNESTYSAVGMQIDAMEDPEEIEAFAKTLTETSDGTFTNFKKEVTAITDPETGKPLQFSQLEKGQRAALARLAQQRADSTYGQQSRNMKNAMRLAKQGRIEEANEALEQGQNQVGAGGFPKAYRETMQEEIELAYKGYEDRNRIKLLKQQANTGDSKDDYREIEATLANAMLSPEALEEFDMNAELKKIKKLKIEDAVKADKMQEALSVGAMKYSKQEPKDEEFSVTELLPFVAFFKETFGEGDLSQTKLDVLGDTSQRYSQQLEKTGYREDLIDEVKETQNKIHNFFKKNPEPTEQQLEQFQREVLMPIDLRTIRAEKYGNL